MKIVSEDGFQFVVRRSVALGSGTLKGMLSVDSEFLSPLLLLFIRAILSLLWISSFVAWRLTWIRIIGNFMEASSGICTVHERCDFIHASYPDHLHSKSLNLLSPQPIIESTMTRWTVVFLPTLTH